jgi:chromate reductase
MTTTLHILGFSGSLRRGSYNTGLLHAAEELLPEGMTLEIFDLTPIPMYNDDVRHHGYPDAVCALRDRITAANALLITTPEYNASISGVLKNAINWISRPDKDGHLPMSMKPVAIMGAATGAFGATKALAHLRYVLVSTNSYTLNRPGVQVTYADKKFDENGVLTDEPTRSQIHNLLLALADFAPRFAPAPAVTRS